MNNAHLFSLAAQLLHHKIAPTEGSLTDIYPTNCPQIGIFRQTCATTKQPTLYTPGLVFLFAGEKTSQLGPHLCTYNTEQGLLLTGVYPVYCDVSASIDQPLMGIHIRLDRLQGATLLNRIDGLSSTASSQSHPIDKPMQGMRTFTVTPSIQAALYSLLNILGDALACQLFIDTCIQGVLYAVVQQPAMRHSLNVWLAQDSRYAQFVKASEYIQLNLCHALELRDIAQHVGLSVPTLHRTFKQYTADSPMQYVKKLRLSQAYVQLSQTASTVQAAAHAVGYESVSQFSREFKRYFGYSPKAVKPS